MKLRSTEERNWTVANGSLIMTDHLFLNKLQDSGELKWVYNPPWCGYHIGETCLILRQSQHWNRNTEKFDWYISTKRYNIVLKTIEDGKLAQDWPYDIDEFHKEGLRVDEDFSHTPDF